jgi:hypothetical protein
MKKLTIDQIFSSEINDVFYNSSTNMLYAFVKSDVTNNSVVLENMATKQLVSPSLDVLNQLVKIDAENVLFFQSSIGKYTGDWFLIAK